MKAEPFLDSVGPVFIVASLTLILVFATWVMWRGSGDWGETAPRAAAAVVEDASH